MKRGLFAGVVVAFAFGLLVNSNVEGGKDDVSTKEIMKKAHTAPKGEKSLLQRVAAGTAEKEDRVKLAELYKALIKNTPSKGDEAVWKKTTTVMHKVAEDAIKDAAIGKKLKVNCGACHKMFK